MHFQPNIWHYLNNNFENMRKDLDLRKVNQNNTQILHIFKEIKHIRGLTSLKGSLFEDLKTYDCIFYQNIQHYLNNNCKNVRKVGNSMIWFRGSSTQKMDSEIAEDLHSALFPNCDCMQMCNILSNTTIPQGVICMVM